MIETSDGGQITVILAPVRSLNLSSLTNPVSYDPVDVNASRALIGPDGLPRRPDATETGIESRI